MAYRRKSIDANEPSYMFAISKEKIPRFGGQTSNPKYIQNPSWRHFFVGARGCWNRPARLAPLSLCLLQMEENGSRVSEAYEGGGSNDSIPNTECLSLDEAPKKRKVMQPRSDAWNHFEKYDDLSGAKRAKCKYCEKTYAAATKGNGTISMNNHLTKCPKIPRKIENSQTQLSFLLASNGPNEGVLTTWKFDQALSRRALAQMIILDELPFSFVEKEGFKKFIGVTIPQFQIPSRRTLTRDCYELYYEQRQSLKKSFNEARPKICLTTDTWTSIQRINYMCLTAHFIDNDWKLHKRIINFCPISSHKGDDMAAVITNCLLD
ncbi:zinc finger BED domain-containing protein RICESLEEPER 1-like [Nicotiana tomentosiformis]|uniref:zinc finger BED domain-containing protein RICESLEEPER 1-like n=1 Tax=Nicotiana tomentosiformis TaxID=4098 RepID=UPI00388C805D